MSTSTTMTMMRTWTMVQSTFTLNKNRFANSLCFQRATALKICQSLWSPFPAQLLPLLQPQLPLLQHPSLLQLLRTETGTCPQRQSLKIFPEGRKLMPRSQKFPLATLPSTEDVVTTEVTASTAQQRSLPLMKLRRPLPSGNKVILDA